MRSLALVVGVPVLLCMIAGTCWASQSAEPQAAPTRASGAFWVLPPAYEFPVSGGGHLSLEIGATPALWPEGVSLHDPYGPRLGVFVYPGGGLEGLALYAGSGEIGTEVGLWGVWRPGSSDGRGGISLRVGIGVVVRGAAEGIPLPDLGLGAAVGFGF